MSHPWREGAAAAAIAESPGCAADLVAALHQSDPITGTNPLRESFPLLDHVGDCVPAIIPIWLTIAAGSMVNRFVPDRYKPAAIGIVSALGFAGASSMIIVHESGQLKPTTHQIETMAAGDFSFDTADAVVGIGHALLTTTAFCLVALQGQRQRAASSD